MQADLITWREIVGSMWLGILITRRDIIKSIRSITRIDITMITTIVAAAMVAADKTGVIELSTSPLGFTNPGGLLRNYAVTGC